MHPAIVRPHTLRRNLQQHLAIEEIRRDMRVFYRQADIERQERREFLLDVGGWIVATAIFIASSLALAV